MTTNGLLIFLLIIIFVICLFQIDKAAVKKRNNRLGGLVQRFPNFVAYSKQAYTSSEPSFQLVKSDGQYLEYRFPVMGNLALTGHYHVGLQNSFCTYLYVFAVNINGVKINGYIQEIHNGRENKLEDLSVKEYSRLIDSLIQQMERKTDFDQIFYVK